MASPRIVKLDIGGIRFRTTYSTLTSVPDSTLATYLQRWTEDGKKIFVDRDGATFKYVLNYLRDGAIAVLPKDMLVLDELKREAQFYKLPRLVQLVDKQTSGDGGCRQVQEGSGSVCGNVIERVEEASSSVGRNQPGQNQSKQQQNGDLLLPKDENEMPICTNNVCVRQGKCGVLQYSDQHMTDVWMCLECYCTIALPQQQTAAVVVDGGTVSKKEKQQKKVIAPVKATHKNPQSLGPGPSKPVVKMSGRNKPTVQIGRKLTQQAHKKHTVAPAKMNGGAVSRPKCNTCDKCFYDGSSLMTHINTVHRGLKPFQCNTCGYSFGQKVNLNRHIKDMHEAPKFECEACGKKFSRKEPLMQHALLHSGEKAYVCEICGHRFTQASGLAKHRGRHHPQITSHQCPKCHMSFVTCSNMKQHLRRAHPIDMQ